jgi:hypothetical protein
MREPPEWVAYFINAISATWDEAKLRQAFQPLNVDLILQIPLSNMRQEDTWVWHYDRRGLFSVRSAYRMLIETRDRREAWLDHRATCSNGSQIQKEWSLLWGTQVPSRVQIFL